MNCPACGYYNPPASVACAHCAAPLLASVGEALCAVHPGVQAMGACSRCGTFGCGTCLSQRGASWLCTSCAALVAKLPWDERESLGLWRAWWRTAVAMISAPNDTLQNAEPDAPIGSSIIFVLLSTIVGYGPTILLAVPFVLITEGADTWGSAGLVGGMIGALVVLLFYGCFLLAFEAGALIVVTGFEHLSLTLLGTPRSYSVTLRAHALGTGAYLTGLLPGCSLYVFPVWSIILRIFAVLQLHKTTPGHAVAGVLLPIGVLCGGLGAMYAALIALAMSVGR